MLGNYYGTQYVLMKKYARPQFEYLYIFSKLCFRNILICNNLWMPSCYHSKQTAKFPVKILSKFKKYLSIGISSLRDTVHKNTKKGTIFGRRRVCLRRAKIYYLLFCSKVKYLPRYHLYTF